MAEPSAQARGLTSPVATASAVGTAQVPAPVLRRIHDWWESQYNDDLFVS